MKYIIPILLLFLSLQSCSKKVIDNDLLGNWSSTKSSNIVDLQFFKDSLIENAWERKTKFSWTSDGSKIYYTQLTNVDPKLDSDFILEYKLNQKKDTLFVKRENDSIFTQEFLRINNAYEYFQKNIGLNFDLPINDKAKDSSKCTALDYNVFVGYRNGELIVKTENYRFRLDEIPGQASLHLASIPESDIAKAKYMLFIDQNVSNKTVDSIRKFLIKSPIHQLFTVYDTNKAKYEETFWKEDIIWFGELETIWTEGEN